MTATKEKKPKRGFMDGYKTYDVKAEGHGSPYEWKDAFRERMGLDEARRVVADGSPWSILGVDENAAWEQVKKAYRKMVMKHHPDKGGDAAMFRKVQGAYEILEDRHK